MKNAGARPGAQRRRPGRRVLRRRARAQLRARGPWRVAAMGGARARTWRCSTRILPYGPRLGLALLRTAAGAWLLGPGLGVVVAAARARAGRDARAGRARRAWAYVALARRRGAATLVAFVVAPRRSASSGRTCRSTASPPGSPGGRWRRSCPDRLAGYAAAAALGAAIGCGDELVQAVLPGRVYDLRDVAMNAVGAVLGVVVARGGAAPGRRTLSAGSSSRRSPRAAGS